MHQEEEVVPEHPHEEEAVPEHPHGVEAVLEHPHGEEAVLEHQHVVSQMFATIYDGTIFFIFTDTFFDF